MCVFFEDMETRRLSLWLNIILLHMLHTLPFTLLPTPRLSLLYVDTIDS